MVIKIIWQTFVPGCKAKVKLDALKISKTVWLSVPGFTNDAVICTDNPNLANLDLPSTLLHY